MKKVFSLLLVFIMLFSAIPTTLAFDWTCDLCSTRHTNGSDEAICEICGNTTCAICYYCSDCFVTASNGTQVSYDADDKDGDGQLDNLEYTITVPAKLAPGGSGTVTLQGMWPSDATIKVAADRKVVLKNTLNENKTKILDVLFTPMEHLGDDEVRKTYKETVSVSDIENAIFSTWNGIFYYDVEYVQPTIEFTIARQSWGDDEWVYTPIATYQAKKYMTWNDWINSDYNIDGYKADVGGYYPNTPQNETFSYQHSTVGLEDVIMNGIMYVINLPPS